MSLNNTIFVCLLVNFLFSHCGYAAISPNSSTIADSMKDAKICDAMLNIQHSHYVEECGKLSFPGINDKITKENRNQFFCLALYDSYMKMCHLIDNSKEKKTKDLSVMNNKTVFDGAIEAILSKNGDTLWDICINLQNSTAPIYNKTMLFVSHLQTEFKKRSFCVMICSTENNGNAAINPLCVALEIMYQEIREKVNGSIERAKTSTTTQHSTIDKAAKTKALDKDQINPQNQVAHLSQLSSTAKNIPNISNQSKIQMNSHKDTSEKKLMGDKKKIVPENGELSDPRSIASKHEEPAVISSIQNPPKTVDNNELISSSAKPNSGANPKIATSLTKPTTISQDTRDEQQDEEQSDYPLSLPDNNNDQAIQDDDSDDNQRPPLKDMAQFSEDQVGEKEKTLRFPSIQTEDDSHFIGYFTIIGLIGIGGCLLYHHKHKILAMIVEGRRSRGGRGRKRPSTASYRKLDCNLEEAVTSQCNSNVTHVIY